MSEPVTCSAADGRCEKEAKKDGLCWAHHKRRQLGLKTPLAAPVRDRTRTPFEALYRAALEYKDELDTVDDDDWRRVRERFRTALRRYLWDYVPRLLRRHRFSAEARAELEVFLATYGDKAGHKQHRRRPHLSHLQHPHHHRRSTP